MRRLGARALAYAPARGSAAPPRADRDAHLVESGVPAKADDIVVTTGQPAGARPRGARAGEPGRHVPGRPDHVPGRDQAARRSPARGSSRPSPTTRGRSWQALARMKGVAAKGLYLMPNCRNPTGTSVSAARRRALVAWSRESGVPIIEDDYGADLVARRAAAAACAARARRRRHPPRDVQQEARPGAPRRLRGLPARAPADARRDQVRDRSRDEHADAERARRVPRARLPPGAPQQDAARLSRAARRARRRAPRAPPRLDPLGQARARRRHVASHCRAASIPRRCSRRRAGAGCWSGRARSTRSASGVPPGVRLTFCAEVRSASSRGPSRLGRRGARALARAAKGPRRRHPRSRLSTNLNVMSIREPRMNERTPVQDFERKVGLAEMLKGGVIIDVVNAEQAKIAEDAGAAAVMALERVPAQIRKRRRRRPRVGSGDDQGDPGGGEHPGDGEVPDRPFHGGRGSSRRSRSTSSTRARC